MTALPRVTSRRPAVALRSPASPSPQSPTAPTSSFSRATSAGTPAARSPGLTALRQRYDRDGDGRVSHADVLATHGGDARRAYAALNDDLRAAGLPGDKWAGAQQLGPLLDDTARYHAALQAGGPKLLTLLGQTREGQWRPSLGKQALELGEAIARLGPAGGAVAVGLLDGQQRRVVRDLDFMSYDAKTDAWTYRDPLQSMDPLVAGAALTQLRTVDSPGNATYASNGDLYTSIQSGGRDQPPVKFHLGKLNPATGQLEAFPDAAFQKTLGGVLGARVIPRPAGLPGQGEVLVALDWKKSQFIAIDLETKREVFRHELPNAFVQELLPFTTGAASFHNDFAVTFDANPDGTFYVTNPPRGSLGVFKPDWQHPERSGFQEILRGHPGLQGGETDVTVGGRQMKLEAFKLFGLDVELPFSSGVDSITWTPDLQGKGPHLLVSPLTPEGAGKLWAIPAQLGDQADVKAAVQRAVQLGQVRPVARVPLNDGLEVVTLRGRPYLFGSDVQGSGAFVMSLDTMKAVPLVRDPRIGWADGMTVRVVGDALKVTFSNSGLGSSLGGDAPPVADRGLYTVELGVDELLARLDAQAAPAWNDHL